MDQCGDLGDRVRAGERAERFRTTPDLPNTFRMAAGPGWALVGDAGVVLDPITAQGIGNALRDADLLAAAIGAGLDDAGSLGVRLSDYQHRRDAAVGPMYDFTVDVAAMRPPRQADRQLLASLQGRQAEINRFIAVFAGVISPADYRSPRNLARVLGIRGLAKLATNGLRSGGRRRSRTSPVAIGRSWSAGRATER